MCRGSNGGKGKQAIIIVRIPLQVVSVGFVVVRVDTVEIYFSRTRVAAIQAVAVGLLSIIQFARIMMAVAGQLF